MSDTCGPRSSPPFAHYDPATSSWRTSQGTFLSGSGEFSGTWPKHGMTRGGCAYELPTWVPPMAAPECSSLLPTPAVNDMGAGKTPEEWDAWTERMRALHGNGNGHGKSLAIEAQRLLPTPTTQPNTGNGHARNLGKELRLLPTPTGRDHKGRNQRNDDSCLPGAVRLLPTPTAGDAASARNSTATRHRLPPTGVHPGDTLTDIVRKQTGASMPPPSADGNESSDDQPRLPLTIRDD